MHLVRIVLEPGLLLVQLVRPLPDVDEVGWPHRPPPEKVDRMLGAGLAVGRRPLRPRVNLKAANTSFAG